MAELTTVDLVGAWISIFLTLCILSFLYEDNPVYKLAEHLFLGVSIGISITEIYYGVFKPNLLLKLGNGRLLSLVPLVLLAMLFFKVSRKWSWVARTPIAFIVAAYAGVKLTGEANANLMTQVAQTMPDLSASWAAHGLWDWQADGAGVLSDVILVVGLVACLVHFYFSRVPATVTRYGARAAVFAGVGTTFFATAGVLVAGKGGPFGALIMGALLGVCAAMPFLAFSAYRPWVTRFGVLMLMLSFGASFGYTVMGRISLAIGRAQELLGLNRPMEQVQQIHPRVASLVSLAIIVAFLVVWRARGGGPKEPEPT
jgi:hypothetical protein